MTQDLKLTVKKQYDGSWSVLIVLEFSNGWEVWHLGRHPNKMDAIQGAMEIVKEMNNQLKATLAEIERESE